jgi:hypothetical protein
VGQPAGDGLVRVRDSRRAYIWTGSCVAAVVRPFSLPRHDGSVVVYGTGACVREPGSLGSDANGGGFNSS